MMPIKSDRLIITKFSPDDWEDYRRIFTNQQVMEFITGRALTHKEAQKRFSEILKINDDNPDIGYFRANRLADRKFVGTAKLVFTEKNSSEVGYTLLPEFWGLGYASEMLGMLVELAKGIDEIHQLTAITDPQNKASIRILEKYDFELFRSGSYNELPSVHYRRPVS